MYNILLKNAKNTHEYEELIKIFLQPDEYEIFSDSANNENNHKELEEKFDYVFHVDKDKNITKKEIYTALEQWTGKIPPWGIVTGIRPVKMTGEIFEKNHNREETLARLRDYYCISDEKANLAMNLYEYQLDKIGRPENNSVGVYIGIPFCPTRCLYCSFASNQVEHSEIQRYMEALKKEIQYVGTLLEKKKLYCESIYVGGGTPTTLNEEELKELLSLINLHIKSDDTKEITVEAGRPDTITKEKLEIMLQLGVDRISINPQTMNDETLESIGRNHNSEEILRAYDLAINSGIENINMDIIAGLPGESIEDFQRTLEILTKLHPANITVHSLAVKRASKLIEKNENFHYDQGETVTKMLSLARESMENNGYKPYYLYRQKHMSGAQENTGYAIPGKENIYNIRIMDEHQTIIALGAGGISKAYYPSENRLERVPNVTNYQIYIDRIDEMIERKNKNIMEENLC